MYNFDKIYGLVGRNLTHSFSKVFFNKKFSDLGLNYSYQNIEIQDIKDLFDIIGNNKSLSGFNVTIPYKESIIPYLDSLDDNANEVGAVNTVKIDEKRHLKGYNTDVIGFKALFDDVKQCKNFHESIKDKREALIFGSGGASKTVQFVLNQENIPFKIVSRNPRTCRDIGYFEVYDKGFYPYSIIINTTPVGMFPDTENYIDLPYSTIEAHNIFIDLIYNPLETIFLKNGIKMGIPTFNGMKMLYEQAEAAWKIWQ